MAKTNNTEVKPICTFSLNDGKLLKSTSKKVTDKMRKAHKIPADVNYLEGLGDQFKFHFQSIPAGLENACLGSFSKELLAIATGREIENLNELENCPLVITVQVFPAPEQQVKTVKNNQF